MSAQCDWIFLWPNKIQLRPNWSNDTSFLFSCWNRRAFKLKKRDIWISSNQQKRNSFYIGGTTLEILDFINILKNISWVLGGVLTQYYRVITRKFNTQYLFWTPMVKARSPFSCMKFIISITWFLKSSWNDRGYKTAEGWLLKIFRNYLFELWNQ